MITSYIRVQVLKAVTRANYLGVHLTKDLKDLKWNIQISKIVTKGNKTFSFLKKNLRVKLSGIKEKNLQSNSQTKAGVLLLYLRSKKEYREHGSYRLEMVQRRAAR